MLEYKTQKKRSFTSKKILSKSEICIVVCVYVCVYVLKKRKEGTRMKKGCFTTWTCWP